MSEEQKPTAPSTSSLLMGEFRRGLKDLQNAVLNPWNGIVATHEESGTIANPTQMEVTQEKGNVQAFQSVLEGYARREVPGKEQEQGMEH